MLIWLCWTFLLWFFSSRVTAAIDEDEKEKGKEKRKEPTTFEWGLRAVFIFTWIYPMYRYSRYLLEEDLIVIFYMLAIIMTVMAFMGFGVIIGILSGTIHKKESSFD